MQKQGHVPEGMDYTTFKGKMANPEVRKAYHAGLQKEKVYSGSLQQFEEQELADIVPKKKKYRFWSAIKAAYFAFCTEYWSGRPNR